MSLELTDKVVVVTGASSGIGASVASLFSEQGAKVGLLDVNATAGKDVQEAIVAAGGEAAFYETDMTSAPSVEAAVQDISSSYGSVDIFVNVAGGSGRSHGDGPVAECTIDGWDWTLELNLKSMFIGCKYAVQHMLKAGQGAIVNVSSVLGLVGGDEDFGTHAYAASKGGAISLTRAIASYYAGNGIRANVICPSLIATPMSERAQADEGIKEKLSFLHPLTQDFGTPENVAEAALFLGSDRSSFITGAVLTVDGGWTVR